MNTIPASEFEQLLTSSRPMIDVRAPIEFNKGAFPASVNLPLMQDDEREKVGTCYKNDGPEAALQLGHQLVGGKIRDDRIAAWADFIRQHPDTYLYCFRGGQRSQISHQWMKEAGFNIPYIDGGYKALRQYLIQVLEDPTLATKMVILSGITGSGKTDFLHSRVKESVDLEGIANHRGSSFGKEVTPQPTQINFENQLAIALLRHQQRSANCLLLEDENRLIGKNSLPLEFYNRMQAAPMVVLEEEWEQRLNRLLDIYVHKMCNDFQQRDGGEAGFAAYALFLKQSLRGITKRLGYQQAAEVEQLMTQALEEQHQHSCTCLHREWIALLLTKYYDPMYNYWLGKKSERIVFKGNKQAIQQWLNEYQ